MNEFLELKNTIFQNFALAVLEIPGLAPSLKNFWVRLWERISIIYPLQIDLVGWFFYILYNFGLSID